MYVCHLPPHMDDEDEDEDEDVDEERQRVATITIPVTEAPKIADGTWIPVSSIKFCVFVLQVAKMSFVF